MAVSRVSDQFRDITVVLEFSRWTSQLHTSLHFLPIEVAVQLLCQVDCTQVRFWRQI